MDESGGQFPKKVFVATLIVISIILSLLLVWIVIDVLLLFFVGILLAIFLCGLSHQVSIYTKLHKGLSLLVTTLGLILIFSLAAWLLAPGISQQVGELSAKLPESIARVRMQVEQYSWGRQLIEKISQTGFFIGNRAETLTRITDIFSSTFGVIANIFIVLVIGLYLSIEPKAYINGIIKLMPLERRKRIRDVIHEIGEVLQRWLIGTFCSMIIVGTLTAFGLWALGVPLALTLGLLTALLTFIPNIGPIVSVLPAALLAFLQSPVRALYVILLYLIIQAVETYLITPQIQRRTISMSPVLIIVVQIMLGVLLGALGLILATPLLAVAVVLIRRFYVEDVLKDHS